MGTMAEFVAAHGITAEAVQVASNPHMDDMPEGSRHWRIVLDMGGRTMEVPYSTGPAITDPPTAADVLDCLASDAATHENAPTFEEWAEEMGYDTDSRRAERTFLAIEEQSEELQGFLGDAFGDLLWETERD